jgi:hypothetical protein
VKQEIDEELRFHIEQRTAENIVAGLLPEEAAREARKRFGNLQTIREECREKCGLNFGEATLQDLRFAVRMLRKHPGSTTVIVLTLGLVIGVCSTLFTAINYQLFQPIPIEAPESLVRLWRTNERGDEGSLMNAARFAEYQRQSRSFAGLTAMDSQSMTLTGRGEPKHLRVARVSPNFFDVFGIKPVLGRSFDATVDADSQADQVVIDYATWRTVFNNDSNVLGATLVLNQQAYAVIGVMPKDLARDEVAWGNDLWRPWDFTRPAEPDPWFNVVGRLKPGVTTEEARSELRVLGEAIEGANDSGGAYDRATVAPYLRSHVDADEIMLAVFFILTVAFVPTPLWA